MGIMKPKILFCLLLTAVLQVNAQITPTNQPAKPKGDGRIEQIKMVGDETHVSAIKASPRNFTEKNIIVAGGVQTGNYYNYAYNNAQATHFSLRFTELTEEIKQIGDMTIYADRNISQPLVDAVLKSESTGFGKIARLKIEVTHR
jgi:hypothetical protein